MNWSEAWPLSPWVMCAHVCTATDMRAWPPEDKVPGQSLGPAVLGSQLQQEEAGGVRTSKEEPQERTPTRAKAGSPATQLPHAASHRGGFRRADQRLWDGSWPLATSRLPAPKAAG